MGADAGFASIIGLAVLVLLYFAQARETASLREQAELSAQRVEQLERRLMHAGAAQPPPAPAPAPQALSRAFPAPGAARAPGLQPTPGVQPASGVYPAPGVQPGPGLQSAPGVQPPSGFQPPPGVQPASAAVSPAPPAGVAAPPLLTATKLIPTASPGAAGLGIAGLAGRSPAGQPSLPAPGPAPATGPRPATGSAPATGPRPATGSAPAPGAAHAPVPAAGHAPVAAGSPGAPPVNRPLASPPPSAATPANRIVTPRPATAAGASAAGGAAAGALATGTTATNGTGEAPKLPPPPPVPPRSTVQIRPGGSGGGHARMLADLSDGGDSPSDLTRVLMALAALAVVAAIVIVLLSVTSGGGSPHTISHAAGPVSNAPTTPHRTRHAKSTAVNDASVTVAVLNGTAVYHLANNIATQLTADGFKQGTVANAATQTQPSTTVEYATPRDQRDAAAVAKALKLSSSSVLPMTPDTQTLCAQASSCAAQVVVTVGADLANTGTQTQTSP